MGVVVNKGIPLSELTKQEMRVMLNTMSRSSHKLVRQAVVEAFHEALDTSLENKLQAYNAAYGQTSRERVAELATVYHREINRLKRMKKKLINNERMEAFE